MKRLQFKLETYGLWAVLLVTAMLCTSCRPQTLAHAIPERKAVAWATTSQGWISRDQQVFGYTAWEPPDSSHPTRAVIIAIHGLSGAALDFKPLGALSASQNIITYAYELRGQGNDPVAERRGDLADWRLWLSDLADFTDLVLSRHPNGPLFYYGESMGALIALHTAAASPAGDIAGLILASPVVQIKNPLSWWQMLLFRVSHWLAPDYRVSVDQNNIPQPRLTRDEAYQKWLQQAPHTLTRFTLRLLGHIDQLMQESDAAASRLIAPVLVLYAGQDDIVAPAAVERFYYHISSNTKQKALFRESYHLLLHDIDKVQVLNTIDVWLSQQITPRAEKMKLQQ